MHGEAVMTSASTLVVTLGGREWFFRSLALSTRTTLASNGMFVELTTNCAHR